MEQVLLLRLGDATEGLLKNPSSPPEYERNKAWISLTLGPKCVRQKG